MYSEHCDVLIHYGQAVQCEVLTVVRIRCVRYSVIEQTVKCEVLTDSRRSVQGEVPTNSGQTSQCQVLTVDIM